MLSQSLDVGIVVYIDERHAAGHYPALLFQIGQIAQRLHRFERYYYVGAANGDKVAGYLLRRYAQVALHVAAALAHAVYLGLLDEQPLRECGFAYDCRDREYALTADTGENYIFFHTSTAFFVVWHVVSMSVYIRGAG